MAPQGKLGVILANKHDGKGTVVLEVHPDSPLLDMVKIGDKLLAIDGLPVSDLACSQITSIIAARQSHQRRLTVLTEY